ncbi:MAG: NAD(P)-dependent oxidoreductase [Pseudomonadota bacterium]
MTTIAFLGLGAMGSRMAARLLEAGHPVTVWNRGAGRVQPLVDRGATPADSPRTAARGADIVLSMVRDDTASERVWLDPVDGALQALGEHSIAVECSTVSLPHVTALATAFGQAKRTLVDAPLAGSRPQADAGALLFFAGGPGAAVDAITPVLQPLSGAVHHTGDVGSGTTLKLLVNALFGVQLAAVAELIGFAARAGLDTNAAVAVLGSTPVCSPAAKAAAEAMLAGHWAPAFPIDLVAKDFGLIAASAASVPLADAAGGVYTAGVDRGYGADNITGVVQLYTPRAR